MPPGCLRASRRAGDAGPAAVAGEARTRCRPSTSTAPIKGWADLWFYVSRQGYSGVDAGAAAWSDRAAFLGWFAAIFPHPEIDAGAALDRLGLAP